MRRIKVVLFAFAMTFCVTSFAQTAEAVQEKFNQAAEAFNNKNYSEAASIFKEVLKMGTTAEGDVAETVKQAKSLLVQSYLNNGKVLAQSKDFDNALVAFKDASALAESSADIRSKANADQMVGAVYGILGNEKFKAADYAAAAVIYNDGYEFNNKDTKNAILAAKSYGLSGDLTKSLALYDAVISLGEKTSRFAPAAKEAKESVVADMLVSSINAIKEKSYDNALSSINIALKYTPEAPNVLLIRLQILNDLKKYSEVVANGPAAYALQPDDVAKSNAAFFIAIAYQELKDNTKAMEYYKKVVAGPNAETAKKLVAELVKVLAS